MLKNRFRLPAEPIINLIIVRSKPLKFTFEYLRSAEVEGKNESCQQKDTERDTDTDTLTHADTATHADTDLQAVTNRFPG